MAYLVIPVFLQLRPAHRCDGCNTVVPDRESKCITSGASKIAVVALGYKTDSLTIPLDCSSLCAYLRVNLLRHGISLWIAIEGLGENQCA